LRNKDLFVKSLFFFHLGTFCRWFGGLLLSPGVEPPFRPKQKVKLDKTEAAVPHPSAFCTLRWERRVPIDGPD